MRLPYSNRWACGLLFALVVAAQPLFAQKFKADKYGYVADTAFRNLIKQRKYQIVSAFDTLSPGHNDKTLAVIVKGGTPYYIDLDGNEIPYDDVSVLVRKREQQLKKPYEVAERKYRELTYGEDARYVKNKSGDLYGLTRKANNKIILQTEYQFIKCAPANYILFKKDGFFGVADTLGKVFIKPLYDYIEPCMTDTTGINLFIASKGTATTVVNQNGKEMFRPRSCKIATFMADGVLTIMESQNGEPRFGLLSKEGR